MDRDIPIVASAAYRDQLARAEAALAALDAGFGRLGLIRLGVFLAGVAAAIGAVLTRQTVLVVAVGAAAIGFLGLVVWHERIARRREWAARSVGYYDRGLARLEHRWMEGGDDGSRFQDVGHLYAVDLELFGRGSLFHYLSTARTETGAATLASWLTAPADRLTIVARQAAVAELARRLELRHDLAVVGGEVRTAVDSVALKRWLESGADGLPAWTAPVAASLGALNLVATISALAGWVPGWMVLPGYLVSLIVAGSLKPRVQRILREAGRPARELKVLAALVARVSQERFQAEVLGRMMEQLAGQTSGAVREIRRLELLVDLVDARGNQLFLPVASLLVLGTQLAAGIQRWRRRLGLAAGDWIAAMGQLEALASLATAAFEHPTDAFPEIGAPGAPLEATGLAHPLLPVAQAVRNDFSLGDPVRLAMVSGSNMSGKSTLLKAIGANLVIGYAGGVVRATRMTTGQWTIGASMVLRDSLLEGRSRFYAEVLRLQQIVVAAGGAVPVLFLLDELLSGTNSHDRAIGARGILEAIVSRGAVGIVTTHDLALTEIAAGLGSRGANWHLEDTLVDGQLHFDYRLRPGVVRRSNALELMKAVGLLQDVKE
jgi:hypothetical protein